MYSEPWGHAWAGSWIRRASIIHDRGMLGGPFFLYPKEISLKRASLRLDFLRSSLSWRTSSVSVAIALPCCCNMSFKIRICSPWALTNDSSDLSHAVASCWVNLRPRSSSSWRLPRPLRSTPSPFPNPRTSLRGWFNATNCLFERGRFFFDT